MTYLPKSITEFYAGHVDFEMEYMKSAKTIWMDKTALEQVTGEPFSEQKLKEHFAYGISRSVSLDKVKFDANRTLTAQAERYGGEGVGWNGGGARCGNFNGFQVKGIGANQLVGERTDTFHSYGGLMIGQGILEIVNTACFNNILPVGCVDCYGLINVGDATDLRDLLGEVYSDEEDKKALSHTEQALVVREVALRPAHFFRNQSFSPGKDFYLNNVKDVARLRYLNKNLYRAFPSLEAAEREFAGFLLACAKQFGFARVFRICHGGLSASNLCLDGRWLDTVAINFVDGGHNVAIWPHLVPFYDEPVMIEVYMREFLSTFCKYNNVDLPIDSLIDYYWKTFDESLAYYFPMVFGLPKGMYKNGRIVLSVLLSVILSADKLTLGLDSYGNVSDNDVVQNLVKTLFVNTLSLQCELENENCRHIERISGVGFGQILEDFKSLLNEVFQTHYKGLSFDAFVKNSAILSFKKYYFRPFFSGRSYHKRFRDVAQAENSERDIEKAINDTIFVSAWVFKAQQNVLFLSETMRIDYCAEENAYLYTNVVTNGTERIESENELFALLEKHQRDLVIADFNFFDTLSLLLNSVIKIMNNGR